jgi:cyclopropane fatty-acyl-phospholipid synthase-like methyltransferase
MLVKKFSLNFLIVFVIRTIFIYVFRFAEFELDNSISMSLGLAIGLTYVQWMREDKTKMTKDYYNQNAKEFVENTLNADMTSLYNQFEKYLKKGDRILDLGCGSGRDSLYFISKGYEVVAVDYSEELTKMASDLLDREVMMLDMREMNFCDEFDGIWACASILHISRDEIEKVMANCESALKQGGIFYLSFKYGNKEAFRNERFFNYYNEGSFEDLSKRFPGLKVLETWRTRDVRVARKDECWLNILIKKEGFRVK